MIQISETQKVLNRRFENLMSKKYKDYFKFLQRNKVWVASGVKAWFKDPGKCQW